MRPASAYVITLRRRADRLDRFLDRWAHVALGIPVHIVWGTDQAVEAPTDPRWNKYPRGTWGCWDSHVRALALADGPTLICEDDAVFTDGFTQVLSDLTLPSGWELVHLGGQHLTAPEPVVPGLVRPRRMLRSHAYLAAYPQRLSAALATTRTHVDYALGLIPLARFAVDPWLVGQDESPGDITRTNTTTVEFWQEESRRGA
jgi:hypothetical protein